MKVSGGAPLSESNKYHVVHTTNGASGEQEGGEANRLIYGQVWPSYFTDAQENAVLGDDEIPLQASSNNGVTNFETGLRFEAGLSEVPVHADYNKTKGDIGDFAK